MIRVAVSGCTGRMGREVVRAVLGAEDLALVGGASPNHAGEDVGLLAGLDALHLPAALDVPGLLTAAPPDVLVDMTTPAAVRANVEAAIDRGVHAVVGTTGLSADDLSALDARARGAGVGVLVAPNFAIGAILLMRFAAEAARHFEAAEIVELHHDRKADAPSGTALKTAELMREARPRFGHDRPEHVTLAGARGGDLAGIRIHSVRLPGVVASQEVLFGGLGQTLTLRHDTFSRESFMPGVLLAVRKVAGLRGVVHGLEHVL